MYNYRVLILNFLGKIDVEHVINLTVVTGVVDIGEFLGALNLGTALRTTESAESAETAAAHRGHSATHRRHTATRKTATARELGKTCERHHNSRCKKNFLFHIIDVIKK